MVELLAKWRRATAKLQDELGRPPTHEEVAKSLGPAEEEAEHHQEGDPRLQLGPADRPGRDRLVARRDADGRPHQDAGHRDGRGRRPARTSCDLLDKMDKREATVLRMRFGLDDEEPKTLKEIGECLGPDPRARPADRERSAGQAEREYARRVAPALAGQELPAGQRRSSVRGRGFLDSLNPGHLRNPAYLPVLIQPLQPSRAIHLLRPSTSFFPFSRTEDAP